MSHAIRIVLVETSHPGNIGAAARALKNMATRRAGAGAAAAVSASRGHCAGIGRRGSARAGACGARSGEPRWRAAVWCSRPPARERDQYFRVLDARAGGAAMLVEARRTAAGGGRCSAPSAPGSPMPSSNQAHALLRIPANPDYASLNLAMAVQIVAYEILCARAATAACERAELAHRSAREPAGDGASLCAPGRRARADRFSRSHAARHASDEAHAAAAAARGARCQRGATSCAAS